jgi:hypothetical protein
LFICFKLFHHIQFVKMFANTLLQIHISHIHHAEIHPLKYSIPWCNKVVTSL